MMEEISGAGFHDEGARANRARVADIWEGIYHWTKKRLPTPGAQNYAFESLGLVEFTPIGAGLGNRMQLAVLQPPQVYIQSQAVPTTGFGGPVAGQMALQPLIDPFNETYG